MQMFMLKTIIVLMPSSYFIEIPATGNHVMRVTYPHAVGRGPL